MQRRRPAPGPVRAAPAEPLAVRPIGASAKNSRSGPPPRSHWPPGQLARAQKIPGQGRPRGAIGRQANWRERKKTRAKVYNLSWNWIFVVAIPRARKSTTFAGIAWCADRMPVQRRRPAPAAYAARPRRREAKPNCRERKKTRAKVVHLLLELLVVLIIRPCKGADRRPARSGPPPRRRLANGQTAASAKKQATCPEIAFLLAQYRCWRTEILWHHPIDVIICFVVFNHICRMLQNRKGFGKLSVFCRCNKF